MNENSNLTAPADRPAGKPSDKNQQNYVTAIDVGTTKIVALVGKRNHEGKVQILGKGTCKTPMNTVKRGVVLNIKQASAMIKEAVTQAEQQAGIKFTSSYVGIAGQHINSRKESHHKMVNSPDKVITRELIEELKSDLENLSLAPGHEIIHIIPQHYIIDKETGVIDPYGMYGNKIVGNFNVIEGETESVKNIMKCIIKINIEVKDLFLEPLASAAAVLTAEEKEAGVAMVDIGGGTTDVAIYYDGILRHTAVIPFGGDIITSDIQKGTKILNKYAEKVKVKFGSAISDTTPDNKVISIPGINGREKKEISVKVLSKIIQARVEEIVNFVNYEILNSGVKDSLGAGIVITGGGSLLSQLKQLITYKTGQDVKLAQPGQNLNTVHSNISSPKYSTAVGLLMLGLREQYTDKIYREQRTPSAEKQEENTQEEITEETKEVIKRKSGDMERGVGGYLKRIKHSLEFLLSENDSDINES
ncbi:MAG: cell division protein FtsA [Bacteroidota bacterium]|nr:cell division protein FtsA [Bacteroidota bacterium]